MTEPTIKVAKKTNFLFSTAFVVGLLFFTFYVLGTIFPDYWWSTHSVHFASNQLKSITFSFSFLFLILSLFPQFISKITDSFSASRSIPFSTVAWGVSLLMGFLFYQFPMVADFYGEATILNPQVNQIVTKVSQEAHNELFTFGLNPWAGQKTIFALITYLSYFSGKTIYTCIIYFDAFFGFCFVLTWLSFINKTLKSWLWKIILTLAVCSAPFLLNFYGHLEVNAIVLWINLYWMTLLVQYFKTKNTKALWLLFLLLIVCLKVHAISLLFAPIWLYLCVSHYSKSPYPISWKKVSTFVLAPVFAVGAFCYFFVFKDHSDPRNLDYTVKEYDHLFLPIFSPEAPLDKYNLFSFNHIFDYFSELLLWSPIALFLLIVILVSYRKQVNWHKEELILTASIFILFASFFFMLNPLLSMQMDWDLFTFPVPILLVLLVLLVKEIENSDFSTKAFPISIALAFLTIPFFTVHSSKFQLSQKLESLGVRVYRTYYDWSSQTIHNALTLISTNRNYQFERKNVLLYKLKEAAVEGNDREYGLLWSKEGAFILDYEKDPARAYIYLEKALTYYPQDNYARLLLMESCLFLDQNEQAYNLSLELQKNNYPDQQTASVTQIQTALFATKYAEALKHSHNHLLQWSNDTVMQKINQRLANNDRVEELKNYFYVPK